MASTKEFLTKVELSDDEIIVWFNYSDKINPDDPDNDSQDFLLQEIYTITVTSRFIIASIKIAVKVVYEPLNAKLRRLTVRLLQRKTQSNR